MLPLFSGFGTLSHFLFCVCVCALHTYSRVFPHTHTHARWYAPSTTTKRRNLCHSTAPKRGNIFFIIPHWGAPARAATRNTRLVRPVCMQPALQGSSGTGFASERVSYKYLPPHLPHFATAAGVGTNPEDFGIWDMHFRGTDGAAIRGFPNLLFLFNATRNPLLCTVFRTFCGFCACKVD